MSTRRRRVTAALVAAAVLALGALIAAFTVAASPDDPPPSAAPASPAAPAGRIAFAATRRADGRLRITGTVPDGITSATIGARSVPVRDGTFALAVAERPDVIILQGPAAAGIPGAPNVAVATPIGDPPAVAVSFDRDPAHLAPLGRPGTLRQAAAAVPFTVLAPDPAPRGVPLVRWAEPVPGAARRVELRYLRTSGPGITVTERAAAPGAPDRRPAVTRDRPGGAAVRTVVAGTVADVTGRSRDLGDLLAVAASLGPVAP